MKESGCKYGVSSLLAHCVARVKLRVQLGRPLSLPMCRRGALLSRHSLSNQSLYNDICLVEMQLVVPCVL